MLCSCCKNNQILSIFEEFIVSNNPTQYSRLVEIYEDFSKIATKEMRCEQCGHKIAEGESYIEDEECAIEKVFQYMAEQIMNEIVCCEQCGRGADIQGLRYSIKSFYYDEEDDPETIFDELDTASTIGDIIACVINDRWDLWEEYFEDILKYVHCPSCNNGSGMDYDDKIDYGEFDFYTSVYTKRDIEQFDYNFYGDEIEVIMKEVCGLAQKFSFDELVSLKNDYIKNKFYIANNQIFGKLEEYIKNMFEQRKWYILSKDRIVFRTRTAAEEKSLSKQELWEPPYEVASQGRYNDIGTSVLYCANNMEVLKKEISLSEGYRYNVAKLVLHQDMKLFPINSVFNGEFDGLIGEEVPIQQQDYNFKQQYVISNIVSAICLKTGYDGIVYRSTKDQVSINYALFGKYEKGKDIEILSVDKW